MQKFLLLISVLLLAACGKNPGPTRASSSADRSVEATALPQRATQAGHPAPPLAPQTVTLWHSYGGNERKALDALVAHWNTLRPTEHIDAQAVPSDAMVEKLQIAARTGEGPDLLIQANDKIGLLARAGLLQPLGDSATPQRLSRFLPQTVKSLLFEQETWGLPLAFRSVALFYNRKLVPVPPKTLAQLVEVGKGFTAPQAASFGLAYDATDLTLHAPFLHGMGGSVWDEAARKFTIDSPDAIKAAELVRGFYTEHKILPKAGEGPDAKAMFNQGKTPFTIQGPRFIDEIAPGIDWGVAVLPDIGPGKPLRPFLETDAILLAKRTQVRSAALLVIDYLTSDEAAITRMETGRQFVANVKIYENPRWLEKPVVRVFHAQAATSVPLPTAVEPNAARAAYSAALARILFAGADPKTALAEAQAGAELAVARLAK